MLQVSGSAPSQLVADAPGAASHVRTAATARLCGTAARALSSQLKPTASIGRTLAVATGTAEGNSSGGSIGEVFRFQRFGAVAEGAEPIAWVCHLSEYLVLSHIP